MRSIPFINQLLLWIILITCSNIVVAEELENYCHDEETNLQWQALETKAGTHPDLVSLSKYRTEICKKVDSGEIAHEEGTILFEIERERVLERIRSGKF